MTSRARVITAAAACLALFIAIVALTRGTDDYPPPLSVDQSLSDAFPARGELTGDQIILDEAAEAWQEAIDDDRNAGNSDERTLGHVEVLFAGTLPGAVLPVDRDDNHADLTTVILSTNYQISTMIRLPDGTWDLGGAVTIPRLVRETQGVLPIGNGTYLLSSRFTDTIEAVELPPSPEDDTDVSVEQAAPRPFEVSVTSPVWKPAYTEGHDVIRLPRADGTSYLGQIWLEHPLGKVDAVLQTTTIGPDGADQALWEQLTIPTDSAALSAAVMRAADSTSVVDAGVADDSPGYYAGWDATIELQVLGGADVLAPGGPQRMVAVALGVGEDQGADVVAAGLLDVGAGRAETLVIGKRQEQGASGKALAATWLVSAGDANGHADAVLYYAAAPDLELDLQVGSQRVVTTGPVGAYVPPPGSNDVFTQPTTLFGTDSAGSRWPSFPVAQTRHD